MKNPRVEIKKGDILCDILAFYIIVNIISNIPKNIVKIKKLQNISDITFMNTNLKILHLFSQIGEIITL